MRAPEVSVVVAHYDDPERLALVLAALELQDLGVDRFEVVVADDGSPVAPDPGPRPYPVAVVRQPDRGFRVAAARNRGVAASHAPLVCFLDGDTVPEPAYLSATLATWQELGADAVLVGRRRHAELAGWEPAALTAWMSGAPGAVAPTELEEPGWLRDAYRGTDDLRSADEESYRYVISAVTSVGRALFDRVGGFEEEFHDYGGEDWEFVYRCWLAGAQLRHVPEAVAWHDGPDFAGRDVDRRAVQNGQARTLARFVTSPAVRPPGLVWEHPACLVVVDDRGWTAEQTLLCVASLLAGTDAGVWLVDGTSAADGPLTGDPRVHVGEPPAAVVRRCRLQVHVDRPVELTVPLTALGDQAPCRTTGLAVLRSRDVAHGRLDAEELPTGSVRVIGDVDLGSLLRRRYEEPEADLSPGG